MKVNINDTNRIKYISRFISIDRLYEIIETGNTVFVRPKLWQDPYENFLFRKGITLANGLEVNTEGLINGVFGQCWTKKNESDFSWRVYTNNLRGARIKVDLNKYYDNLINQIDLTLQEEEIIIGKVQYLTWKKIKEYYENPEQFRKELTYDIVGRRDLFLKRREFSHESEYRVIYSNPRYSKRKNDIIKFYIETNELIEDILLDPRYTKEEAKVVSDIIRKLGYTGIIRRSNLYSEPEISPRL